MADTEGGAIDEVPTAWIVQAGWQGSVADLASIAHKVGEFVDELSVTVATRHGSETFDSAEDFSRTITPRLLAGCQSIEMSGRSQEVRVDALFARRRVTVLGETVAGVGVRIWTSGVGAAAAERVSGSLALALELGRDPVSPTMVKADPVAVTLPPAEFAPAWHKATSSRRSNIAVLASAAVVFPLVLASGIHGYLEPGKSTLSDVLIWCACNEALLFFVPLLCVLTFAGLDYVLPSVDVGDRPGWRRLVAPLTKLSGASYVLAAVGKAVLG